MDAAELAKRAAGLLRAHPGAAEVPTPPPVLRETINVCDELQQVRRGAPRPARRGRGRATPTRALHVRARARAPARGP
jgi:hypothetical protein